jgi:hypothetical protein
MNEINETATAFSLATLIAMTGTEAVEARAQQRSYCPVYSHGGADCSFKSKAQCEAAVALDQGAECYQDDGEVYLANSSSPSTQLQLSKYQTPTLRKGELP